MVLCVYTNGLNVIIQGTSFMNKKFLNLTFDINFGDFYRNGLKY